MDEMDRQREIEERARKRARGEKAEMIRVQLRRIVIVKTVNCPTKDRPIGLDECRLCKDNVGLSVSGEHVYCKVITQMGRSVEVSE